MARVSTFMYAEGAAQVQVSSNESKLQISAPLQVLQLLYVPGTFSFSVVIGIMEIDLAQTHQVQIKFKRAEDDMVIIDTNPMAIPPAPADKVGQLPLELQGFVFSIGFQNVNFKSPGEYKTELLIDGELLEKFPITVVERADNHE